MIIKRKIETQLDIRKFSNVRKVERITTWIQIFVHIVINKENEKICSLSTELELTKVHWIKNTCIEYFPKNVQLWHKENKQQVALLFTYLIQY